MTANIAPPQADVTLFLVRHATHADFGRRLTGRAEGVPLTALGKEQADAVGRLLASEGLTAIHSSPRERAVETAEAIARASGIGVDLVEALDEIDFGEWTGAEFEALSTQALWDDWNSARAASRTPGGESMGEAADRIAGHVMNLAANRPGARIALVTHCDMIRAMVATCLDLSLDNLLRFEIAPASVSRLVAGRWGMKLVTLNQTVSETPPISFVQL